MEYVDGTNLTAEITERRRIPWPEVIDFALQIGAALKAAHDAGIVHRDLKPSNLMLTRDRVVKLTDFGVAHVFATTRLTRTGGVVGTAEYMSPEQAQGKRATKRSDLYSLGAVMYVMLTGRPPFTGPTANDILQKHQFANFDKPSRYAPDCPRQLEDFVCQLLEKDPSKRLPDALVLIKRLEQIRARIAFAEQQSETATLERPAPGATIKAPGSAADSLEYQPGTATLIRDLLRDDAAQSLRKSPVARFFDNTFVLLLLLGLIIIGGFYFAGRSKVDPVSQLERAKVALDTTAGPGWLRARDELLQPLLLDDRMEDRRAEIQALISQVDQYEFCRTLKVSSSSDGTIRSEIQRLVRRAFDTYSAGDPMEAEVQVRAILEMLQHDPDHHYLCQFLDSALMQWTTAPDVEGRRRVLLESMESAEEFARHNDLESARQTLQAVIRLYQQDAAVAAEVRRCRAQLETVVEQQSVSDQPQAEQENPKSP